MNKQCLPKQEIIDNLRLELRDLDIMLKKAFGLLKRTQSRLEQWDKDNICSDDDLYTDIFNTLLELDNIID